MSSVVQEAAELMRQIQKLSKELNPVKTALLALKKRELATPNTDSAANSLAKIIARVESVQEKYRPFLRRLYELLDEELPDLFVQTPLLVVRDETLDSAVSAVHEQDMHRHTTESEAAYEKSARSPSDGLTEQGALFSELCPPTMPYVLQPENYRAAHAAMTMQADAVEYLIATERLALARHVRRSYHLPRLWFPQLPCSDDDDDDDDDQSDGNHTSKNCASTDQNNICGSHDAKSSGNKHGGHAVGRDDAGAASSSAGNAAQMTPVTLPQAEPCVTSMHHSHLLSQHDRLRKSHSHTLPPSALDITAACSESMGPATIAATTAPTRAAQPHAAARSHERSESLPGSGSLSERVLRTLKAWSTRSRAVSGAECMDSSVVYGHRQSHAHAAHRRRRRQAMPNLVVRAVCTALFLKDEYLDRMILERVAEHHGYEGADAAHELSQLRELWRCCHAHTDVPAHLQQQKQPRRSLTQETTRASKTSSLSPSHRADAVRKVYDAELLARVQSLRHSNLCTQSNSALFDAAMMNLVEDLFTHTLRRSGKLRTDLEERASRFTSLWGVLDLLDSDAATRSNQNSNSTKCITNNTNSNHSGANRSSNSSCMKVRERLSRAHDNAVCGHRADVRHAAEQVAALRSCQPSRLLSAEEMLLAEEQWCNTIMTIKRPSRYYCMLTGGCMNDTTEQASPIALPNGIIVSHRALIPRQGEDVAGSIHDASAARHAVTAEGKNKRGEERGGERTRWTRSAAAMAERLAQIGAQYVFVT